MSVKAIVGTVILVLIVALLFNSVYVVNSRERAIVRQFGEIIKSDVQPGLNFKAPVMHDVLKFDGRILTLDTPAQRYFTVEKKPVIVDLFVKWRIGNVEHYYKRTNGDELVANRVLTDRVNEGLRNQVGRRSMHDVISGERDELMTELTHELDETLLADVGIHVIDVRVKKIELPEEVSISVFQRMNSEREIEARQYRATGREVALGIEADADRQAIVIEAEAYRDAERIRGDGDAEAARIYANAYGQDEEFYAFYRSINAYKTSFAEGNSLMVIDPSSEFFRYLTEKGG